MRTIAPADADELAQFLTERSARNEPVLVQGGGTRVDFGNPPREVHAVLSTAAIRGIDEFDAVDGVVRVHAGTPLVDVTAAIDAAGWELPLDPPGATTTVGGAIATGATGPRRQQFGAAKNALLGLDVVLASGERTSCGGRVVKNVTGYDMAKLYAGSFGTLGVITAAWLRLRPKPALVKTTVVAFDGGDCERALGVGHLAARRASARMVAVVTGELAGQLGAPSGTGAAVLVVEYGGDVPAVERDIAWLLGEAGGREVPEESRLAGRLRELQGSGDARARISALPSELPSIVRPIATSGVGTVVYPGVGIAYAIDVPVAEVDGAAKAVPGAETVFEALPLAERRERDVFGDPGPGGKIARALKERFDPAGILNPGRFQGRL